MPYDAHSYLHLSPQAQPQSGSRFHVFPSQLDQSKIYVILIYWIHTQQFHCCFGSSLVVWWAGTEALNMTPNLVNTSLFPLIHLHPTSNSYKYTIEDFSYIQSYPQPMFSSFFEMT